MNEQKEAFFDHFQYWGLAYSNVRIEPSPSEVDQREVDISSQFSRNVRLEVPIVSAAMDTVTESEMAISMAKLGGLGVIHAGLDPEAQKKEVRRVKLHLNGLIETPVSFSSDRTLESILNECDDRMLDFRTFPIVDSDNKFVGLLTQNDFDMSDRRTLSGIAMTPSSEVISAGPSTDIKQAFDVMKTEKKKTLPLLNNDGSLAGLYIFSDVERIVKESHGLYTLDGTGRLIAAAALPTDDEGLERIELMQPYLDVAVFDTSKGNQKYARWAVKEVKNMFPDLEVVAGNVSDGESAKLLYEAGADGIKIGQGPGAACKTMKVTNVGLPQVSAIYECARALRGSGVPVCADGGIRQPGDVSTAIAVGADTVMIGSKLAATKESPKDIVIIGGQQFKPYRGMGSLEAMKETAGARKRYQQDENRVMVAEGESGYMPYIGPAEQFIGEYATSLANSFATAGSANVEDHQNNTRIRRVDSEAEREGQPHDMKIA